MLSNGLTYKISNGLLEKLVHAQQALRMDRLGEALRTLDQIIGFVESGEKELNKFFESINEISNTLNNPKLDTAEPNECL